MTTPEFKGFPKIPRFGKFFATITEKIDGTNAGVFIGEDGSVLAASRKRWLLPANSDNYGFRRWAEENADELRTLGPGMHWGEWWGRNIQRGYDLTERRFSLLDVSRWHNRFHDTLSLVPTCCHVVPILDTISIVSSFHVGEVLERLRNHGSLAAPGYMNPEGIVIYHNAGKQRFKLTFDNTHKGEQKT